MDSAFACTFPHLRDPARSQITSRINQAEYIMNAHQPSPQQRRRNRMMGLALAAIVLAIYAWVFVRGSELMG